MAISFANQDISFKLTEKQRIKRWIEAVVRQQGKKVGAIGYLFCDDEGLLRANQEFLQHDTYTDIITFDYVERGVVSGDIMISVDRVRENAATYHVTFDHEMRRVIIHGILHLLGQKDKSPADAAAMRKKEEEALKIWETV